jgi:hypothetical protein
MKNKREISVHSNMEYISSFPLATISTEEFQDDINIAQVEWFWPIVCTSPNITYLNASNIYVPLWIAQ